MNDGINILHIVLSLTGGVFAGLVYSLFTYPSGEVRKVLKEQVKMGYKYGQWNHFRELVDHNFKKVVKPNCETLYSTAFIRRKDGPYILEMPEFDSYFGFTFININTDIMGYITNRDTGRQKVHRFIISYTGDDINEPGMQGITIDSDICWIIGRYEINSPGDIKKVEPVQDSLKLIKYQDYPGYARKEY